MENELPEPVPASYGALSDTPLERIVDGPGIRSRQAAEKVAARVEGMCGNILVCKRYGVRTSVERSPQGGFYVAVLVPPAGTEDDRVRESLLDQVAFAESAEVEENGKKKSYLVPIGILVREN